MQPNLYRILTALATRDTRRAEFRAAVRQLAAVCREPSMLLMAGAAAGATAAAIFVVLAH